MPSAWGASRTSHRGVPMTCPVCGLHYDKFRTGLTFLTVRRDIIAIGFDNKTQKTKYGRRNGTLGFWHEQKFEMWAGHVAACEDAEMAKKAKKKRKRAA